MPHVSFTTWCPANWNVALKLGQHAVVLVFLEPLFLALFLESRCHWHPSLSHRFEAAAIASRHARTTIVIDGCFLLRFFRHSRMECHQWRNAKDRRSPDGFASCVFAGEYFALPLYPQLACCLFCFMAGHVTAVFPWRYIHQCLLDDIFSSISLNICCGRRRPCLGLDHGPLGKKTEVFWPRTAKRPMRRDQTHLYTHSLARRSKRRTACFTRFVPVATARALPINCVYSSVLTSAVPGVVWHWRLLAELPLRRFRSWNAWSASSRRSLARRRIIVGLWRVKENAMRSSRRVLQCCAACNANKLFAHCCRMGAGQP